MISSHTPLWRKIEATAKAREAARANEARERALLRKGRARHGEVKRLRKFYRSTVEYRVTMQRLRSNWQIILDEVAAKHGLPAGAIVMRGRRQFTAARFEAAWRLYTETTMSLPKIAQCLGRRDHTTVRNAVFRYMQRNGIAEHPSHRLEITRAREMARREQ